MIQIGIKYFFANLNHNLVVVIMTLLQNPQ